MCPNDFIRFKYHKYFGESVNNLVFAKVNIHIILVRGEENFMRFIGSIILIFDINLIKFVLIS